jgi:hypothetical protein
MKDAKERASKMDKDTTQDSVEEKAEEPFGEKARESS